MQHCSCPSCVPTSWVHLPSLSSAVTEHPCGDPTRTRWCFFASPLFPSSHFLFLQDYLICCLLDSSLAPSTHC